MPIPQSKAELQQAITETYSKLKSDLKDIPNDLAELTELEGHAKGTQMSICNLVAYLIGWGELVIKWHNKSKKGEVIDFPETGYKWNELGHLAQKFYKDYNTLTYPELLSKLDTTVLDLRSIIEETDSDILYKKQWYKQYTFGRMIQLNTSSPYKNARTRVRKWKRGRGV